MFSTICCLIIRPPTALGEKCCSSTCLAYSTAGCPTLSAGGTSVIETLPNGQLALGPPGPTVIHAFEQETFVVTTPATSSLGTWAPSIHSILLLQDPSWKHDPVYYSDSSTRPQNDIGSFVAQHKDRVESM